MKTIDLPDNNGGVYSPEGITRTEDGKTIVLQGVVEFDPATAAPLAPRATEATLLALKNVTDNLLLATQAIKLAVEGLNTAAIAGEVSVNNLPATQAISAAALPLPAGASTEATLIAVKNALDALGGNTDTVEALQTAANATLANLAAYNDSVETLLTAIGSNSDGLETLLATLGLQTDELEPKLQEIANKLPTLVEGKTPTQDADVAALQADIKAMNFMMQTYLAQMLAKMPRINANDRLMADLSETSLATISAITTLTTLNDILRLQAVGTSTANFAKFLDGLPEHIANLGAQHLYNNIKYV